MALSLPAGSEEHQQLNSAVGEFHQIKDCIERCGIGAAPSYELS